MEGEADSWDFGVGAGFYVNATRDKWRAWQMYDYVAQELPRILTAHYGRLDTQRCSVMGHSMGGHGALILFLKNPTKYRVRRRVLSAAKSRIASGHCLAFRSIVSVSCKQQLCIIFLSDPPPSLPPCHPTLLSVGVCLCPHLQPL